MRWTSAVTDFGIATANRTNLSSQDKKSFPPAKEILDLKLFRSALKLSLFYETSTCSEILRRNNFYEALVAVNYHSVPGLDHF